MNYRTPRTIPLLFLRGPIAILLASWPRRQTTFSSHNPRHRPAGRLHRGRFTDDSAHRLGGGSEVLLGDAWQRRGIITSSASSAPRPHRSRRASR